MERYSFFNAVIDDAGNFDREYLAEDYANYFASFIGNGIYTNSADNLQVIAKGDLVVGVKTGKAWINGYYYENTTVKNFTLDIPDASMARIDRVVVRLDFLERKITTEIKKGTNAYQPVAQDLQRDEMAYELALADIKINGGTTEITQAEITDQRFNENLCGVVAGVVQQIDTEGLFAQYDAEFSQWFEHVKGQLDGDIAGKLQNEINTVASDMTTAKGDIERIDDTLGTAKNDITQMKGTLGNMLTYEVGTTREVNISPSGKTSENITFAKSHTTKPVFIGFTINQSKNLDRSILSPICSLDSSDAKGFTFSMHNQSPSYYVNFASITWIAFFAE